MGDERFERSRDWLNRALKVTPAGSQTYSKSYRYLSGDATPYFIEWGDRAHVWDVDGNEFVDFILGLGPVLLGYNHPEVNEAIVRQLEKGITFSQASTLEPVLAEVLTEVVPCAEMVRFVKSGSDATAAAVRLARAATGREMVALCGYHGMHDWCVGASPLHRGVPEAVRALSAPFKYNQPDSLQRIFDAHPGQVAAVILEPVQAEAPRDGFLEAVQRLAHEHGAVLIFDEVVSGFRIALGGAQEYYGVVPDLAAIGKGMANGMPLSAVVGKRELMKLIEEGVFISTTFGGETLSLAAALKTIEILRRPDSYEQLWDLATLLFDGAKQRVDARGLSGVMRPFGLAPHGGFLFGDIGNLTGLDLLSVYQQALLERGILSLGINNLCLAHTDDDIDRHLEAMDAALENVASAIDQDSTDGILRGPGIHPIFPRN